VGIEPTRPFDHRLSRPAPYQAWGIPHASNSANHYTVFQLNLSGHKNYVLMLNYSSLLCQETLGNFSLQTIF
jgi:hypothetical protein